MCIATKQQKEIEVVIHLSIDHESFVRQARRYGLDSKKSYLRTCDSSAIALNQLGINRFFSDKKMSSLRIKLMKKVVRHLATKNGLTKRVNRFRGNYLFTPGGE